MTRTGRKSLRPLLLFVTTLALLFASGCNRLSDGLGLTGQVKQIAPEPIAPQRLRVILPSLGAEAILAPVARRQDVTVWQTLDGITLAFQDGLLINTRGLGNDLMSSDVSSNLSMLGGAAGDTYYPQTRSYLDGEDRIIFQEYKCHKLSQQNLQLTIGATPHSVSQIEENCSSQEHEFENIYWVDQAGVVLKSRQWVSLNVGFMETEYVDW